MVKDVAAAASKLKPGFNPLLQFSQVIDRLETLTVTDIQTLPILNMMRRLLNCSE